MFVVFVSFVVKIRGYGGNKIFVDCQEFAHLDYSREKV